MKHLIRIVTHLIVSATVMLLFVNVFASPSELAGYILLTMLLVAFLYILRNKTESFWVFLGCHFVLLLGGSCLIGVASAYKWYIAIWCFWILYSAILRLVPAAENLDEPGAIYIVVLVMEHLGIRALEVGLVAQRLSLISTIIVFLLYLLYGNLESMDEFIYLGSFSSKVDEQGMRKLNRRISLLYTGILGVLLAVFSSFRVDGLWNTVSGWLRSILRFLVSLIPMSEQVPQEEKEEAEKEMSNMLQQMMPEQEIPAWRQLMQEIFRGIMIFVIVAAIIAGIVYAAMYVYRHFYNKKEREDGDRVIENLSFGERITKEKKMGFFERFEKNPARRIRRIYKKRLKRAGAKNLSSFWYMSPDEQVQLLRKQGVSEETIEEMKDLYEKARYSTDLVTDVEVERMRTIL